MLYWLCKVVINKQTLTNKTMRKIKKFMRKFAKKVIIKFFEKLVLLFAFYALGSALGLRITRIN